MSKHYFASSLIIVSLLLLLSMTIVSVEARRHRSVQVSKPKPAAGVINANSIIKAVVKKCHSTGDPHLRTFSESTFDYYSIGEYVFAEAADKSIMIQARTGRLNHVSGNIAVAVTLDEEVALEYHVNGNYFLLDGKKITIGSGSTIPLGSKGALVSYNNRNNIPYVTIKSSTGAILNMNGWSVKIQGWYLDLSFEVPATLPMNYGFCVDKTKGVPKESYFNKPMKRVATVKTSSINSEIKEATPEEKKKAHNVCTKAGISEKAHPNDFKSCYLDALISPENASKFAKSIVNLQKMEKVSSKEVAKEAISNMDKKDLVKIVAKAAVQEAKKQDVPAASEKKVASALKTLSTNKLLSTLDKIIENKAAVRIEPPKSTSSGASPVSIKPIAVKPVSAAPKPTISDVKPVKPVKPVVKPMSVASFTTVKPTNTEPVSAPSKPKPVTKPTKPVGSVTKPSNPTDSQTSVKPTTKPIRGNPGKPLKPNKPVTNTEIQTESVKPTVPKPIRKSIPTDSEVKPTKTETKPSVIKNPIRRNPGKPAAVQTVKPPKPTGNPTTSVQPPKTIKPVKPTTKPSEESIRVNPTRANSISTSASTKPTNNLSESVSIKPNSIRNTNSPTRSRPRGTATISNSINSSTPTKPVRKPIESKPNEQVNIRKPTSDAVKPPNHGKPTGSSTHSPSRNNWSSSPVKPTDKPKSSTINNNSGRPVKPTSDKPSSTRGIGGSKPNADVVSLSERPHNSVRPSSPTRSNPGKPERPNRGKPTIVKPTSTSAQSTSSRPTRGNPGKPSKPVTEIQTESVKPTVPKPVRKPIPTDSEVKPSKPTETKPSVIKNPTRRNPGKPAAVQTVKPPKANPTNNPNAIRNVPTRPETPKPNKPSFVGPVFAPIKPIGFNHANNGGTINPMKPVIPNGNSPRNNDHNSVPSVKPTSSNLSNLTTSKPPASLGGRPIRPPVSPKPTNRQGNNYVSGRPVSKFNPMVIKRPTNRIKHYVSKSCKPKNKTKPSKPKKLTKPTRIIHTSQNINTQSVQVSPVINMPSSFFSKY